MGSMSEFYDPRVYKLITATEIYSTATPINCTLWHIKLKGGI